MEANIDEQKEGLALTKIQTIAGAILAEFLDVLGAVDGFADVADRLRTTVLDNAVFTEVAVRAALFGEQE